MHKLTGDQLPGKPTNQKVLQPQQELRGSSCQERRKLVYLFFHELRIASVEHSLIVLSNTSLFCAFEREIEREQVDGWRVKRRAN